MTRVVNSERRRITDFAGERVACTVAGYQTEIHFDFEHQPAEPAAGLPEGYVIGHVFVRLTVPVLQALTAAIEDAITIHVARRDVPIDTRLDSIVIGRGHWQVFSAELEDALAMWLWDLDAACKGKPFSGWEIRHEP